MKKNKKGISLIVLAITIVVMVILAGAVILTMTNSGIIGNTKVGISKNNAINYKEQLQSSIANKQTEDMNFEALDLTVTSYDDILEYIPSMKEADSEKFAIYDGELVYIGESVEEDAMLKELGINTGFVVGRHYDTIYINPHPFKSPADFDIVSAEEGWTGAIYGGPTQSLSNYETELSYMIQLQSGEPGTNEGTSVGEPVILLVKMNIGNMVQGLFYSFGDTDIELSETLSIKPGWNASTFTDGELTSIEAVDIDNGDTLDPITDFGYIVTINSLSGGVSHMGNYFSISPYTN